LTHGLVSCERHSRRKASEKERTAVIVAAEAANAPGGGSGREEWSGKSEREEDGGREKVGWRTRFVISFSSHLSTLVKKIQAENR
jgi:hypothetical protein